MGSFALPRFRPFKHAETTERHPQKNAILMRVRVFLCTANTFRISSVCFGVDNLAIEANFSPDFGCGVFYNGSIVLLIVKITSGTRIVCGLIVILSIIFSGCEVSHTEIDFDQIWERPRTKFEGVQELY